MKLPHYLQLGAGLAIIIITWIIQQNASGGLVLPAVAITVLTLVKSTLGLLTDSVPTALRAKAAARAARLAALCVFFCGLGAVACQGCVNGQPPPVVTPSVDLAVCILNQYTGAPSCRPTGNWVLCVATIANACGADAVSVEQVLTADRKARVADGFVLLAQDAGK